MYRWKDTTLSSADKAKILRNAGTYTILLLTLVAMALFGVCSPKLTSGLPTSGRAAAVVDGDTVSSDEFQRAYRNAYQRLQYQYNEAFDPAAMQLSRTVLASRT